MQTPYTFIFIGRSGCGKGTQARLLDEYIKKADEIKKAQNAELEKRPILYVETGARFREFLAKDGYTENLARARGAKGMRQPDFLAVWMWSHVLVEEYKGNEHWIIDGTPRSLAEAHILDTVFDFYNRPKPIIIHLDVSREWSEKHLKARGRADDSANDITERLNWFDRDVVPAIEFFRTCPGYTFIELNGEKSIEEVYKDLIAAAFPS